MHILGAIAEFERGRIVERVKAGLVRARAQGRKLGRPERQTPEHVLDQVRGLSVRAAAVKLGVAEQTVQLEVAAFLLRTKPDSISASGNGLALPAGESPARFCRARL